MDDREHRSLRVMGAEELGYLLDNMLTFQDVIEANGLSDELSDEDEGV